MSKRIVSILIPLSYEEPLGYFLSWFDYLRDVRRFKLHDPLFPATKLKSRAGDHIGFFNTGLVDPVFWENAAAIREIFKKRFLDSGIKYYHPHTFRHALVREVSKLSLTEVQKKAFSQSIGHNNIGMTFGYYGQGSLSEQKQIEILKGIDFGRSKATLNPIATPEELGALESLIERMKNPGSKTLQNEP